MRHRLQEQYAGHSHIRFLGSVPQPQLVGAYQSATALILPSLAPEVFPLTVLEALACGTPAVVHDAGGNREAVEQTGGGFVYRSREELRRILSALAQDTTLQETLAQRARIGVRTILFSSTLPDSLSLPHRYHRTKEGYGGRGMKGAV